MRTLNIFELLRVQELVSRYKEIRTGMSQLSTYYQHKKTRRFYETRECLRRQVSYFLAEFHRLRLTAPDLADYYLETYGEQVQAQIRHVLYCKEMASTHRKARNFKISDRIAALTHKIELKECQIALLASEKKEYEEEKAKLLKQIEGSKERA